MVFPVQTQGTGMEIINQLSALQSARVDRKATKAQIPGIQAKSQMAVQQAQEFTSELAKKRRKTQREAETQAAQRQIELDEETTANQRAKLKQETSAAVIGKEQNELAHEANLVATATEEQWGEVAEKVEGAGFTGNWEEDQARRQEYLDQATQTIGHRQNMETQRVQLELAEQRAKKLPELWRTATRLFPDDPEAQQAFVLEREQAITANIMAQARQREQGDPSQVNVSSPTREETLYAGATFEDLEKASPEIGGLSQAQKEDFKRRARFEAKAIQKQANVAGQGMSYPQAYEVAVAELSQYIQPVSEEDKGFFSWFSPDYAFTPPKALGHQANWAMPGETGEEDVPAFDPGEPISAKNHGYTSPVQVKKAYQNGEISKSVAKSILQSNFSE